MTCNAHPRKTQNLTKNITKPPPHIGGGITNVTQGTKQFTQGTTDVILATVHQRQCSSHGVGGNTHATLTDMSDDLATASTDFPLYGSGFLSL